MIAKTFIRGWFAAVTQYKHLAEQLNNIHGAADCFRFEANLSG